MALNIGNRVKIAGGSGIDSDKQGVIIDPKQVPIKGNGVPNIPGHYKPVDWSKQFAIKYDDGSINTMFKNRVIKLQEHMNYRDFYKSKKNVPENVEGKELLRGLNLEDNACDDGLPKREDGSLDTVHDGRPIHLSKIVQIGKSFGKSPANGELNGFTALTGGIVQGEPELGSESGPLAKQPGDKEPMLAGGKGVDSSIVTKSVGGPVTGGQKQGGLNSKGTIAGTPSLSGGSEGESDESGATELTLQEAKSKINSIVKEVLKEISFNKSTGKWVKKSLTECSDDAGFPTTAAKGRPQYKVAGPQYRTAADALARVRQYEPEITEMYDEEEETKVNERYTHLMNAQRNLSENELTELRDLGVKLEKRNENEQNQEKHEHKEVDLIDAIKHAVDKLGGLHKGMEEDESVEEAQVNMKMGPSHKTVQQTLAKTSEPDQFSRTNQYNPKVTEAGGGAVQHSSFRTANDARQLPKNRTRGDIDEVDLKKKLTDSKELVLKSYPQAHADETFGYWKIFLNKSAFKNVGIGRSEAEAWAKAHKHIAKK